MLHYYTMLPLANDTPNSPYNPPQKKSVRHKSLKIAP